MPDGMIPHGNKNFSWNPVNVLVLWQYRIFIHLKLYLDLILKFRILFGGFIVLSVWVRPADLPRFNYCLFCLSTYKTKSYLKKNVVISFFLAEETFISSHLCCKSYITFFCRLHYSTVKTPTWSDIIGSLFSWFCVPFFQS